MKKSLLLFVLSVCQIILANRCTAQDVRQKTDVETKLTAISETIETVMKLHDVPAVSCCIVSGQETFFINHGTPDRNTGGKIDEKSIYQMASQSKVFVGLVAKELIINETMKASDSIAKYLPKKVVEATKQKLAPITVFDLICHRSGLPRDTLNPKSRRDDTYVNYDYNETDLLRDLDQMELVFDPDKRFMYSNFGYSLLAYLCERASGRDYSKLVEEYVTKRMEMKDTSFELSEKQRLVTPYDHKSPTVAREPARIGILGPPTSLYSTTSDLAKLMKKQLADYRRYRETKKTTSLVLTDRSKNAWPGTGIKYGYGFFDWGNDTYGHGGGMDGYGCEYTFDPQGNVGFILLTSSCESWSQRLNTAVIKTMNSGDTQLLTELIAIESIVSVFEKHGPDAALQSYQQFRGRNPSPLGEESRITLVNLAAQKGLRDAAQLFLNDAITDFPKSKRIKKLAKAMEGQ